MPIGTVPSVLDISHVGQSGTAAHRLHAFLDTLATTFGSVPSPFRYVGNVTLATDFPLLVNVAKGDFYHVVADVTDSVGGGRTGTTQSFLAGDEIVWNSSDWTVVGQALTNPYQFKGNIAAANQFPPPAATLTTGVKDGHVYRVTTGCTDNDATKTNTAQVFLTGDIIVWRTNAWYIIQKAPSAATPAAIGTAAAGTSGRPSNDDHVHAASVVLSSVIEAKASAVDIHTDESEQTAVLGGDAAKHFVPTHLVIQVATVTGTPATPGAINVGTAADGAQIASGIALTGLVLVGDTRMVPLTAQTQHIAGNATLYVNVETAEAAASVMTCDVWVKGFQV